MKRLILLSALMLLLTSAYNGQSSETQPSNDEVALQKLSLLSDLQALDTRAAKIDAPLAQAQAKAEIADAAWTLDKEWAKKLLREAYELTLPDKEEQAQLREKIAGAPPTPPTGNDRVRGDVRNRVLSIANRDKPFADGLVQLGAKQLGKYEEHFRYASLAGQALQNGDKEAASKYILQSVEADPTQITAGFVIRDLAAQDRAAADKLIIQYIERLRTFPLSITNQGALRTYFILGGLVFPSPNADRQGRQILPAGPSVIKAYVNYVIESMSRLEQSEPGSADRLRGFLLSVWLPLKQYAPELTGAFLELERLSRRPGEDASLPQKSFEEAYKEKYEKRLRDALDSGQPDELTINSAVGRGDFDKARKLIDKLSDGPQKTQLTEMVNMREALSLTAKGNTIEAELMAEKLNKATSILQVYPAIISKCAAKKDQPCVTTAFYQAMKQLKSADTAPPTLPAGIPASVIATSREFDPVLSSLGKLAKAVAPVNDTLALEALDETVSAANSSDVDTSQGRIGFDTDIFKILAPKNELRALQAAMNLKDPLRQIIALAVIDQWKAKELANKEKEIPKEPAKKAKPNGEEPRRQS